MNGKLEVIDAFNTAVAQAELDGVAISKSIDWLISLDDIAFLLKACI